jgi:hypothetical protein
LKVEGGGTWRNDEDVGVNVRETGSLKIPEEGGRFIY